MTLRMVVVGRVSVSCFRQYSFFVTVLNWIGNGEDEGQIGGG